MLDLFISAQNNVDVIEAEFKSACVAAGPGQAEVMGRFAAWVEKESTISINVSLSVVISLLNGHRHQNIYEWAAEESRLTHRTMDSILRERLKRFYERRLMFDHAFEQGERFRYAALNAGGAGLPQYKAYCMVMSRVYESALTQTAYWDGDSLEICLLSDGTLDPGIVVHRAVPRSHRQWLVAKERVSEMRSVQETDWSKLVIASDKYFEVVFIGDVSLGSLESVRIPASEQDRMWDMAFGSFGAVHGPAERAVLDDFIKLNQASTNGRIKLEVLA